MLQKNSKITWLLIPILLLLPFLVLSFYTFPAADDYCAALFFDAHGNELNLNGKLYEQYNGRFAANFLLFFSPLNEPSFENYSIWIFSQLILLFAVVMVFISACFNGNTTNKFYLLVFSLFFFLFILRGFPDIAEGAYWLTGSAAYLWGTVFLLLHLHFVFRWLERTTLINATGVLFSLIPAMGFNEVQSVLIPLVYLFFFVRMVREKQKLNLFFVSLVLVAAALLIFVLSAPGNFQRIRQYEENFNFFPSIGMSLLQTLRFLGSWIFDPALLSGALLLLMVIVKNNILLPFRIPRNNILFGLLVFQLFLSAFLPYLGTGILGQHRTINWAYVNFLVLFLLMIMNWSRDFRVRMLMGMLELKLKKVLMVILLMGILLGNTWKSIYDFTSGSASAFYTEQSKRVEWIRNNDPGVDNECPVLKNQPYTLFTFDLSNAGRDWIKDCTLNYYKRKTEE